KLHSRSFRLRLTSLGSLLVSRSEIGLSRHRALISRGVFPELYGGDEAVEHLVEKRRLLEVKRVTDAWQYAETRGRDVFLHEHARDQRLLFLGAGDDQNRHSHPAKFLGEIEHRGAGRHDMSQRHRTSDARQRTELVGELSPAARILEHELDPRRASRVAVRGVIGAR